LRKLTSTRSPISSSLPTSRLLLAKDSFSAIPAWQLVSTKTRSSERATTYSEYQSSQILPKVLIDETQAFFFKEVILPPYAMICQFYKWETVPTWRLLNSLWITTLSAPLNSPSFRTISTNPCNAPTWTHTLMLLTLRL
jgi:hypothetical protein